MNPFTISELEALKRVDYTLLPEHMREGMRLYVENGIRPGDFLYLVLCNDFVHALGHADPVNTARIVDFARFLWADAPFECWGSREKVAAWIAVHKLERKKEVEHE